MKIYTMLLYLFDHFNPFNLQYAQKTHWDADWRRQNWTADLPIYGWPALPPEAY